MDSYEEDSCGFGDPVVACATLKFTFSKTGKCDSCAFDKNTDYKRLDINEGDCFVLFVGSALDEAHYKRSNMVLIAKVKDSDCVDESNHIIRIKKAKGKRFPEGQLLVEHPSRFLHLILSGEKESDLIIEEARRRRSLRISMAKFSGWRFEGREVFAIRLLGILRVFNSEEML